MIRRNRIFKEDFQYKIDSNKDLCVALDDVYFSRKGRSILNHIVDQDYYTIKDIDELSDYLYDNGREDLANELQDAIALDRQNVNESISSNKRKNSFKENRIYNNEFVPEVIEDFLKKVAQYSGLYDYLDVEAFEKDVFNPKDKNVKALKQLYKQAKEATVYDDKEELKQIYQEVADIVTGVDDRNPESWSNF